MESNKEIQQEYFDEFHRQLEEQRENSKYTDVELRVQGKVLHCHRVVLEAASPYFKAMFASGMKEETSGVIDLKDLEVEADQLAVDFMYRGTCDMEEGNIESLVHVSDLLQIRPLRKKCENFLVATVKVDNCVQLFKLANLFSLSSLKKVAQVKLLKHFMDIFQGKEILDLTLEEIIEIFKQDDLEVDTENPVFELLTRWVNHESSTRIEDVATLLEFVRLPFCSKLYLSEEVNSSPLMQDKLCATYLQEAISYQACPVRQHSLWSCRTRPRKLFKISQKLMIFGGAIKSSDEWIGNEQCYGLQVKDTAAWIKVKANKLCDTTCSVPGGILNVGDNVALYSVEDKKWKKFPTPLKDTRWHGMVYHDGNVYIVGGQEAGSDNVLSRVEVCALENPGWKLHSHLPVPLYQCATVSHGKEIFVFGGMVANNASCKVYACNVFKGSWEEKQDIPLECSIPEAVSLNGDIYVISPVATYSCTLKYSPKTDTWIRLSPPPLQRIGASAAVWYGIIVLCGGSDMTDIPKDEVQVYDIKSNMWTVKKLKLPKCIRDHMLLNIPHKSPAKFFSFD